VTVVEPVRVPSVALMPAGVRSRLAGAAAALERNRLAAGRRRVESAARVLDKAGWRAHASVRSGVPLAEILATVRRERADLLVLGARGTGGLDRLLLGSVADGALKQAQVSVLIVK
jgi:nucleotide-binding universal stress UspA family protein